MLSSPDAPALAADERVVRFFSRLLVHGKGPFAGKPFKLEPWQENDIIRPLFGKLRPDGTRQYRTAYVEIPRKNGKSTIAAGIALYLLVSDGEEGAEIYGAAADRDQASIVFNTAADMVRRSPALSRILDVIDSSKRIVYRKTNSVYRAIPADAAGSHGFNASGIVFDEVHTQPNRDLWNVLTTSTGARRQPLTFAITTAGYDRNSICWHLHEHADQVQRGVIDDPSFFGYLLSAPENADWRDESVWHAVNPGLGVFRSLDEMRDFARRAEQMPSEQNAFRQLYLNQWTAQAVRWLDMAAWDHGNVPVDPASLRNRTCYAGLDLSSTTDLSAFVLVFPSESGLDVLAHFWMPEENLRERANRDRVPYEQWVADGYITATPGNVIDYAFIRAKINEYAHEYDIRDIGADPYNARQLLIQLGDDGLPVVEIRQGFLSLTGPTKELQNHVLGRRLRHGGNPVLRWMADNVMVTRDAAGNIKPDKAKSTQRIDGIAALVNAIDRVSRQGNGVSVYDDPGYEVLVL